MDASRLLSVINDIELEYKSGFIEKLDAVVSYYIQARDNPGQDLSSVIQDAIEILEEQVNSSVFVDYPPSKQTILEAINGIDRVGFGFLKRFKEVLSVTGQTTAGLVTNLTELSNDLKKYQKGVSTSKTGLTAINIQPYSLEKGKFEAGILIPEILVDSKLGTLAKQLDKWNTIVKGIQEVAGENEREVEVTGLAKGSYEIYLPLGIIAAGILAKIIERIFDLYQNILELRELRIKMQNLGAPVEETEKYRNHEQATIEKSISELAKEIIKESAIKIDESRKNELQVQIEKSIRQIAHFVDKGGIVEVYTPPVEDIPEPIIKPEDETSDAQIENERKLKEYNQRKLEVENVNRIRGIGRKLWTLPDRIEPILQLGESEDGDNFVQQNKQTKRK